MLGKLLFILLFIITLVLAGYTIDNYVKKREALNRKRAEDKIKKIAEECKKQKE